MRTHTQQPGDRLTTHEAIAPVGKRGGFTLIELMVTVSIIGILLSISAITFTRLSERNALGQAKNAVLVYSKLARSYAMANRVETMLVVNPANGRFEIWHMNPPVEGGAWDPSSSGTYVDGYTFAPVLDSSAKLPVNSNGKPMAVVSPIDFEDRVGADTAADYDNLTWAAFCFDEKGRLVIRSRRIATRTYRLRNGDLRTGPPGPNRTTDETPKLSLSPLVDSTDTLITSTKGFTISEWSKMRSEVTSADTASELVNNWLVLTHPGEKYDDSAETIVLNRLTGQELSGAK